MIPHWLNARPAKYAYRGGWKLLSAGRKTSVTSIALAPRRNTDRRAGNRAVPATGASPSAPCARRTSGWRASSKANSKSPRSTRGSANSECPSGCAPSAFRNGQSSATLRGCTMVWHRPPGCRRRSTKPRGSRSPQGQPCLDNATRRATASRAAGRAIERGSARMPPEAARSANRHPQPNAPNAGHRRQPEATRCARGCAGKRGNRSCGAKRMRCQQIGGNTAEDKHFVHVLGEIADAMVAAVDDTGGRARKVAEHFAVIEHFIARRSQ